MELLALKNTPVYFDIKTSKIEDRKKAKDVSITGLSGFS
jgi:hypothetical protein